MGRKLFVGNLSFETSGDELREAFSRAGTCESATVLTDRMTGRSRGFGFVEMSSNEEAERAIVELNGYELGGRRLNVSEARERTAGPRPPRNFGPGPGSGYSSNDPGKGQR